MEEGPRELTRRAAQNRRDRLAHPAQEEPAVLRSAVLPTHANYTALMQSHDRVRTNHLHGKSEGERA